jgi:signal transduction histidine kinase
MVFQGTAIPNLIIEVAGIMICLFALITIWYGSPRYTTTKRFMTAAFSSMLAYNLCLLFLEFSQAAAGNRWRTGVILVAFGTYLFPVIAAYIVSLFVAATVGENRQEYRWLFRILTILAGTGIIALILAQLTGNLVLADEAGRFSYGAASSMGFVVTGMFMIIDLIMLLRLGQNITPRQRNAFIAYLSLPLLSIPVRRLWPGVYVVALSTCISMMIMLIVVVDEQSKSLRRQELDNEQLKVDLMLSQIQPHFLFNVLYVIQEICLVDAETASKAISDFSRYLRHNMDSISINRPIPFKEELEHVRHYVSLQQLRFGDALDVRYELRCTEFELPTLTLQPLVENAIRYGVRKSADGEGTVTIRTEEFPDHYEVHVIDDGPGFVPDQLPEDGMSHMGLKNVRGRLERICGGELNIKSEPGKGTDATIVLPKKTK